MLAMPQMRGYKVEHPVLQHETICDTSLISDCLRKALSNIVRLHLCHALFQWLLDEDD